MRKYIKYLLFLLLLVSPLSVHAMTGNATLSCDKARLNAGESTTCTLSGTVSNGKISNLSGQVSLSSNLEFVSFTTDSVWQGTGDGGKILLYTDRDKEGSFGIGRFVVRAKAGVSGSNESISVTDIKFYDAEYAEVGVATVSHSIRIPSLNNNLSSLTVEGASLSFSPDVLEYQVTLNQSNTTIAAATQDGSATLSGDIGYRDLNYGVNTFRVVVTSESGASKTYVLNITRPDNRSTDNRLKSLSLSKGSINFQPNVTSYNVTVDTSVSQIQLNATLNDNKSHFADGLGPRTVNLNYGNNIVQIKVIAENGAERVYTITIYRKEEVKPATNNPEEKSNDNYLKQLYLNNGVIDFKPEILTYSVTLPFSIKEVEIHGEANQAKAQIEGLGKKTLNVGENKFEVKVTAENGETRVYTITITRREDSGEKLDSNNKLKSLKIKDRDLDFNKNQNYYEVMLGSLNQLDIKALAESEKATVTIIGNENLKVGDEIKVIVTSEEGINNIYHITLIENNNLWLPIGIGIFALGLIAIIGTIIYRNRKNKHNI